MKHLCNIYTVLSILLITLPACKRQSSATYIGNGAVVIVCRDNQTITSIELLDSVEAKTFQKSWKLDELFKNSLDSNETLEVFLERLAQIDPVRAERYYQNLINFDGERSFVNEDSLYLSDTKDDFSVLEVKENCRKETLISQIETPFLGKKYAVNKELFNHPLLSNGQKALAMLHEFIYRELISEEKVGNSQPVRSYSIFLASETFGYSLKNKVTNETRTRYLRKTIEAKLSSGYWKDFNIALNIDDNKKSLKEPLPHFCPNFNIYRAYVIKEGSTQPSLTQWDCKTGEVEKEHLRKDQFPKCEYSYCSTDKELIVKRPTLEFGLHKGVSEITSELSCEEEFPVLDSYVCSDYEHNPLESVVTFSSIITENKVTCSANLEAGRWASVNFFLSCRK